MKQILLSTILLFLTAGLSSCGEAASDELSADGVRVLFTVPLPGNGDRIALVGSINPQLPYHAAESYFLKTSSGDLVKVTARGMFAQTAPCAIHEVEDGIAFCDEALYLAPRHTLVSYATDSVTRGAMGLGGRLLYLVDSSRQLHVADGGGAGTPSDDGLFLVWSPTSADVTLISGNGRRVLAEHALPGHVSAYAVEGEQLFLAWYAEERSELGISIIDLADFHVREVGEPLLSDVAPSSLAVNEGVVAIAFERGGSHALIVDTDDEKSAPLQLSTTPDRVFAFPLSGGFYFWSSAAGSLTKVDNLSGEILSTQIL